MICCREVFAYCLLKKCGRSFTHANRPPRKPTNIEFIAAKYVRRFGHCAGQRAFSFGRRILTGKQAMTALPTTTFPGVIPVLNPANQEHIGEVPQYERPAVLACVDRALAAQRKWAGTSIHERIRILKNFR